MLPEQSLLVEKVLNTFQTLYKEEPIITRSPGRVNIIGEHLDYNEGYVLPAAIDKAIYVGISKRNDDKIYLHSIDYNENYRVSIQDIKPTKTWATYVLGVTDQLIKRGHKLSGFNVVLDGDVPVGAGLSSSAALECAAAFALNELFSLGLEKIEMVKIAQKAEHAFAGVMVGIMDMFASMFGKKDHVIKLDCRSLEYEYKPLKLEGYKVVLFNTNVEHSLASSEYNTRRKQCEQGVAWVKEHHPEVTALRDADMNMLNEYVLPKDEIIYKRCKYVVEEIDRLLRGSDDLERGDIKALGQKMFRTHEGLSKDYEVSCKELDFLVEAVKDNEAVIGARMMGGGFGGCTINIIKEEAIKDLKEKLSKEYTKAMGLELTTYIAQIENGTERIR